MLSTFDSSADFLSTRAHGVFNASTDRKAPNFHAAAAKYNLHHGVPTRHLRLSDIQLVRFSRRLLTRIVALSTRPEYAMYCELRAASICAMTAAQWREQRERRDEVSSQEAFPCTMDSLLASRPPYAPRGTRDRGVGWTPENLQAASLVKKRFFVFAHFQNHPFPPKTVTSVTPRNA